MSAPIETPSSYHRHRQEPGSRTTNGLFQTQHRCFAPPTNAAVPRIAQPRLHAVTLFGFEPHCTDASAIRHDEPPTRPTERRRTRWPSSISYGTGRSFILSPFRSTCLTVQCGAEVGSTSEANPLHPANLKKLAGHRPIIGLSPCLRDCRPFATRAAHRRAGLPMRSPLSNRPWV